VGCMSAAPIAAGNSYYYSRFFLPSLFRGERWRRRENARESGRTGGNAAAHSLPCRHATSSGVRGQGQRSAVIVCKRLLRPSDFGPAVGGRMMCCV
jgi:hypothetical protein